MKARPYLDRLGSLGVLLALVALWWVASNAGWVSRVFLPTPQATFASLLEGLNLSGTGGNGELLGFTQATVGRMIEGWLLASLFGVLLGAAIGVSPSVRAWVQPTLEFIRPLPASSG
jgi:sulfonate transport system permease protein